MFSLNISHLLTVELVAIHFKPRVAFIFYNMIFFISNKLVLLKT
jgi:hypothetical protein